MRAATLSVLGLIMVAAVSHVLADPAFVKIEGLSAPSTNAHSAYPGPAAPMQVLNFTWGPTRSGPAATEWKWSPYQQGSVLLTRTPDLLSTRLESGAVAATKFSHVIITRFRNANGQQQIYQRVTLTNVVVASVRAHNVQASDGGITRLEDVTLLFERSQIQAVFGTVLSNGTFKFWQKAFDKYPDVFPK